MDYKKILKGVIDIINTTEKSDIGFANICSYIGENCPELKDSEDDKTKEELIHYLKGIRFTTVKCAEKVGNWIDWLEKQGEQETLCDKCKKEQPSHSCQDITELGRCAVEHEKKPTNKVEPKFHEGDWLCENEPNNYARTIQILEIVNVQGKNRYRISRDLHNDEDIVECRFVEDNWHPFNIKDAKAGDVLASKDGDEILIFRNLDNNTSFSSYYNIKGRLEIGWSNRNFIPATKEQRDALFAKMKEDGYEWDAERKELKKVDSSTAWSEEDEAYKEFAISAVEDYYDENNPLRKDIVNWLKSLKDRVQPKPKQEWSEEDKDKLKWSLINLEELKHRFGENYGKVGECISWLKSLKHQKSGSPPKSRWMHLLKLFKFRKELR